LYDAAGPPGARDRGPGWHLRRRGALQLARMGGLPARRESEGSPIQHLVRSDDRSRRSRVFLAFHAEHGLGLSHMRRGRSWDLRDVERRVQKYGVSYRVARYLIRDHGSVAHRRRHVRRHGQEEGKI
jgi:hypothetical protein